MFEDHMASSREAVGGNDLKKARELALRAFDAAQTQQEQEVAGAWVSELERMQAEAGPSPSADNDAAADELPGPFGTADVVDGFMNHLGAEAALSGSAESTSAEKHSTAPFPSTDGEQAAWLPRVVPAADDASGVTAFLDEEPVSRDPEASVKLPRAALSPAEGPAHADEAPEVLATSSSTEAPGSTQSVPQGSEAGSEMADPALIAAFQEYQRRGGLGSTNLEPAASTPMPASEMQVESAPEGGPAGRGEEPGESASEEGTKEPRPKNRGDAERRIFGLPVGFWVIGLGATLLGYVIFEPFGGSTQTGSNDRGPQVGFPVLQYDSTMQGPITKDQVAAAFRRQSRAQSDGSTRVDPLTRGESPFGQSVGGDPGIGGEEGVAARVGSSGGAGVRPPTGRGEDPATVASQETSRQEGERTTHRRRRGATSAGKKRHETVKPQRSSGGRFFPRRRSADGVVRVIRSGAASASQGNSEGVQVGASGWAKLEIGIASSRHGRVLARVTRDIKLGSEVVVPRGALLQGESSSDADRVYIKFGAVVIDGKRKDIDATAVSGDFFGLNARKRKATLEERQSHEVKKNALDLAADAADVALGMMGTIGDAARKVGEGALGEAKKEHSYDPRVVLVVDAGVEFEVVVMD